MSNQSYVMVLERPILKVPGITYLSCRGPDRNISLVAQCQNDELEYLMTGLEQRQCEVRADLGYDNSPCWNSGNCLAHRSCIALSFLPHMVRLVSKSNSAIYALQYECFEVDRMVRVRELVQNYYVSPITAYRLAFSLLTLVDWYVRMRISGRLSINNLLVDLTTSYLVPIDWSGTLILEYLPSQTRTMYYCQFARIMLRLIGAKRTAEGWEFPIEYQDERYHKLTKILRKTYKWSYDPPKGGLAEAIDYEDRLYEQQQGLAQRLLDALQYSEEDIGKPPYEILSKIKED